MQEATITIRIDESLRDDFTAAAASINRPGSQVLRDLIRDFVASVRAGRPMLTPAQLAERRMAVDFARDNSELEGKRASPEFNEDMERVARGELDIDEVLRRTEARFRNLRAKT
jgi:hypothetical protein